MKCVYNNPCEASSNETWNDLVTRGLHSRSVIGLVIEKYHNLWIARYYSKFSNDARSAYVIDHPDGTHWAIKASSYESLKQRIDADMLLEQASKEHHIELDI